MKNSKLIQNILRVYCPFLGLLLFCVLLGYWIYHRYTGNLAADLVEFGGACLVSGLIIGLTLATDDPIKSLQGKENALIVRFSAKMTSRIIDTRHYLEHESAVHTVASALGYYNKALDIIRDEEGEIIIRRKNGSEERFDPVSVEAVNL